MQDLSNAQVLAELRAICGSHERATELLDELADRLDEEDWVLPVEVIDALKTVFPKAGKRTIEGVERRCKFAHRVWAEKYGPFNVEQGRYAIELMVYAIRASQGQYAFLYSGFDQLVNHERVDEGFKKRAGDSKEIKFDVMELLQ